MKLTRVDGRRDRELRQGAGQSQPGPGSLSGDKHPCAAQRLLVMVQLKVLSGKKAGTTLGGPPFSCTDRTLRRRADLQLEEDGRVGTSICNSTSSRGRESPAEAPSPTRWPPLTASPFSRSLSCAMAMSSTLARLEAAVLAQRNPPGGLALPRRAYLGCGIAAISLGQVGLIYWLLH